jgi:hypothetical protein
MQAVGTTNEAAAILEAMNRVLDTFINPRRDPKDDILDQPESVRELSGAMNVLHSRGYVIDEAAVRGGADEFVYFMWLADKPGPRSETWLEFVKTAATYGRFPMQIAALNSIPQPLPNECVDLVKARLSDRDLGVCRAACTIAGRSGNKMFVKPLLEIIATEHHEWLLREATEAANKLGVRYELLDVWAERLAEEELYGLALDSLQTVIEALPGSSSGRTDLTRDERIELRTRWRDFLTKHASELRNGKKFKIGDPAITPALFGRARTWQLPDGKFWPITWEEMHRIPPK